MLKIIVLLQMVILLLRKSGVAFIAPMSSSSSSPRLSLTSLAAGKIKIEDILKAPQWPEKWPFNPSDFSRQDPSDDVNFYGQPRLVYHIDDGAVKALTNFYKANIKPNTKVLDICSSWVSHYPDDFKLDAVGLGMNEYELSQNKQVRTSTFSLSIIIIIIIIESCLVMLCRILTKTQSCLFLTIPLTM
jgi:hypothetical protein